MPTTSSSTSQTAPPCPVPGGEDERFLREQLITYLGNKRSLLAPIGQAVRHVQSRLGKDKLDILDAFAGSGVVSRFFKQFARRLVANDLEQYAKVIGDCYLANRSAVDGDALHACHRAIRADAEKLPIRDGFVRRLYAPCDDEAVQPGERVFYTTANAMRIDSLRHLIGSAPAELQLFLLAPLLSQASIHANTSGVFKGFYKDAATGLGQFGGSSRDALQRITGSITLPFPLFSRFECDVDVRQEDANTLVPSLRNLDLAYFDPPYNQHPYGSNYFMLNLIVRNEEPTDISTVSGIPANWQRSDYNKRAQALAAMQNLIEQTDASHLLISYNSEGFISRPQFDAMLKKIGRVQVVETIYNTFRGSRNLRGRPLHVREQLFLVERH